MKQAWSVCLLLGLPLWITNPVTSQEDFASAPSAPYEAGNGASSVEAADLYFQHSITFDPDRVFVGNGGCSPSAVYDYLQIAPFIVPTVEFQHLALRWYQAQPSAGSSAPLTDLTYFDLVNGLIITTNTLQSPNGRGGAVLNYATQVSTYNYTVLTPTVTDLDAYNSTLKQLLQSTTGLANGGDNACSPSDKRANSVVEYLQYVQSNISSIQNIGGGLRPTEVELPNGCIEELHANYAGDAVSGIITNGTFITADDCCGKCRAEPRCNVFVYCPDFDGCPYGEGQTFPFQGCQLKQQAGLQLGRGVQPQAFQRGSSIPFASGRITS